MFTQKVKQLSNDELGQARLWLTTIHGDSPYDLDIYLVNNTGETLDYVEFGSAGMITIDDEAFGGGPEILRYTDVKQGEAVKVEQLDTFYDSDFLVIVDVKIKSELLGIQEFRTTSHRAKSIHKVLLN
ncbi:hypothetical protein L9G16_05135 [Shewanella sp. A25]|nr:hypothetical protein [Shewanella shenzhenensis]